ncbi:MAG: alpha/beta fold hydrolase [Sphingobium sp.]
MADRQTLLLLCGIGEDEAIWTLVADALAASADCHALVPRGDGIEPMALDVLARFGGPIAVAGHSLGGYVAMAMQRAAPARITRIALLNSSARPEDEAARSARLAAIDRIGAIGFVPVARRMAAALAALPTAIDPAAMLLRGGAERFVREQHAAIGRPDARTGLAGLAIPLLVVGGGQDRIVPPDRSVEIAAAVPHADLVLLPDCGHLSPVEAPDAVITAMRGWLAR